MVQRCARFSPRPCVMDLPLNARIPSLTSILERFCERNGGMSERKLGGVGETSNLEGTA